MNQPSVMSIMYIICMQSVYMYIMCLILECSILIATILCMLSTELSTKVQNIKVQEKVMSNSGEDSATEGNHYHMHLYW